MFFGIELMLSEAISLNNVRSPSCLAASRLICQPILNRFVDAHECITRAKIDINTNPLPKNVRDREIFAIAFAIPCNYASKTW